MFDGIFRAQLTEDKIGTVSLLVGKAPWNFICSKGQHNSWVLRYLGCCLISSVFIERPYFSLINYSFEGRCVDLKLPKFEISKRFHEVNLNSSACQSVNNERFVAVHQNSWLRQQQIKERRSLSKVSSSCFISFFNKAGGGGGGALLQRSIIIL